MKRKDLTGQQFGSLIVLEFDENRFLKDKQNHYKRIRTHWICKCTICGKHISVRGENLISGNTKGCGCDKFEKSADKQKGDNNFIYSKDLLCYIGTTQNTKSKFYISKEDFPLVSKYYWYETKEGYLQTRIPKTNKKIFLHRFIMFGLNNINNQLIVDHANRNRMDCRRENLRIATPSQNCQNQSISKNNTSGVLGVSFDKNSGKYRAYVCVNRRYISLGYYDTIDGAKEARKLGEIKYYKNFAPSLHSS